jgi:hypothetical protein
MVGDKLGVPTYLIQHAVGGDVKLTTGCDITVWKAGDSKFSEGTTVRVKEGKTEIRDALDHLEALFAKHTC